LPFLLLFLFRFAAFGAGVAEAVTEDLAFSGSLIAFTHFSSLNSG